MTLPLASAAKFKVDGSQLDGFERQDTRQGIIAGKIASARTEYFPGTSTPFVLKGAARPSLVYMTGPMRADTYADLLALIDQHRDFVANTTTCSLTLHGNAIGAATPLSFEVDQNVVGFTDDDTTNGFRVKARFLFQLLSL